MIQIRRKPGRSHPFRLAIAACLTVGLAPTTTHAQPTVTQGDSLALVALYNATGGPNWTNADHWLNSTVYEWEGVSTNLDLRVTGLFLSRKNLTGRLPEQITNLDRLEQLFLTGNSLDGPIPAFLGDMSSLESLQLSLNQFSDAIPPQLGNLTNLTFLILNGNQLTGTIPSSLGNLEELTSLALNFNQLDGAVPREFEQLGNLEILRLEQNELDDISAPDWSQLTKLQQLFAGNNNLSGPVPESVGNATDLTHLGLEFNQLSGEIPSSFGGLSNLTDLNLTSNMLEGSVEVLGALESLEFLFLDFNEFVGAIPASLANAANLRALGISNNQFDDLPDLSGLESLGSVFASRNRFTFEDLEPYADFIADPNKNFRYAPQALVETMQEEQPDGTITLSVDPEEIGGTGTTYQWYRDNEEIAGANQPSHTVSECETSAAGTGTYRVVSRSPLLPDLVLAGTAEVTGSGPVLMVNTIGDEPLLFPPPENDRCHVGGGIIGDQCTLRAAIQIANKQRSSCEVPQTSISFDIPGDGIPTIAIGNASQPLPDVRVPTIIDGTTQAGGQVAVDGRGAETGLTLRGGSSVKGLLLTGFKKAIVLRNLANTVRENTLVGNETGVYVRAVRRNTIAWNTISGQQQCGIHLEPPSFESIQDSLVIENNLIGVEDDGITPLPNRIGICARGRFTKEVRIVNNTVSGNRVVGILLAGSESLVQGNRIGPDAEGLVAIGNGFGLVVTGKHIVVQDNTISGNQGTGIAVGGSVDNRIVNNKIGTDHTGTVAMGNAAYGLSIGADGSVLVDNNVISANDDGGVEISKTEDANIVFRNNKIGSTIHGGLDQALTIPNKGDGVTVVGPDAGNLAFYSNFIAYNLGHGIDLRRARQARLLDNRILENGKSGIRSEDGLNLCIRNNELSGNATGIDLSVSQAVLDGNLITASLGDGLTIEGGSVDTLTGNNITENDGPGLNHVTPSEDVFAENNWWGDASGPGGQGPGAGDEVSEGVDYDPWLDDMVGVTVATECGEIRLASEQGESGGQPTSKVYQSPEDTVSVFVQNWVDEEDDLDVEVADSEGWLLGPTSFSVSRENGLGAEIRLPFEIPAGTPDGTVTTVEVIATSQADPSRHDSTAFSVRAQAPVLTNLIVLPDTITVAPGDTIRFEAVGIDQFGREFEASPEWTATGGSIDGVGVYVAGDASGVFTVTAVDATTQIQGEAVVNIGETVLAEDEELPLEFSLAQNYPNPFNPVTTIEYTLPTSEHVYLVVNDVLGRRVTLLRNEVQTAGTYRINFDGQHLSSGMYVYRLSAGNFIRTRTMILAK